MLLRLQLLVDYKADWWTLCWNSKLWHVVAFFLSTVNHLYDHLHIYTVEMDFKIVGVVMLETSLWANYDRTLS